MAQILKSKNWRQGKNLRLSMINAIFDFVQKEWGKQRVRGATCTWCSLSDGVGRRKTKQMGGWEDMQKCSAVQIQSSPSPGNEANYYYDEDWSFATLPLSNTRTRPCVYYVSASHTQSTLPYPDNGCYPLLELPSSSFRPSKSTAFE